MDWEVEEARGSYMSKANRFIEQISEVGGTVKEDVYSPDMRKALQKMEDEIADLANAGETATLQEIEAAIVKIDAIYYKLLQSIRSNSNTKDIAKAIRMALVLNDHIMGALSGGLASQDPEFHKDMERESEGSTDSNGEIPNPVIKAKKKDDIEEGITAKSLMADLEDLGFGSDDDVNAGDLIDFINDQWTHLLSSNDRHVKALVADLKDIGFSDDEDIDGPDLVDVVAAWYDKAK